MSENEDLKTLARLYGIQTSYHDALGNYVEARPEALLGVLQALEAPLDSLADVPDALRGRREDLDERVLEPAVVAWDGQAGKIELRLGKNPGSTIACHLDLENGERRGWVLDVDALPQTGEGVRRLLLPESIPPGYHNLRVEIGGKCWESLVIAAPSRAYTDQRSLWGVFLPLYALRTERSWGAGDFSDLETLAEWTASLGGGVVATLPLLAAFLDEPCEPSPYAPASRLFWNELYIDPRRLPEMDGASAARRLIESP
jgi:4-alpha-glucanotransferase